MGYSVRPLMMPRELLARIFRDDRSLRAFESIQQTVQETPDLVTVAQETADQAVTKGNSLQNPSYVVIASSGLLNNERVITSNAHVTVNDGGANSPVTFTIHVTAALGYTPANRAGDTFSGSIDVQGEVRADSLRLDQSATASTATVTHSVPVNVNGTVMYLLLSATP